MNAQGVSGVSASDVPQILVQEPGASAPTTVVGENGEAVAATGLTALFNQSGQYIGSYGIDPSTGAFAAWDADGNETSFQTFAAEHQLANGATPVSSDGGNAVLYNASGQLIGLDVNGYIVNTPTSAQSPGSTIDGLTTVYDVTGQNELGTFGYANGVIEENGSSAIGFLESQGFSASELTSVEQSLATNGAWDLSNTTDAAVQETLVEDELSQSAVGQATINMSLYNTSGSYVGEIGLAQGTFEVFDQNGTQDSTPIDTDDDITSSEVLDAAQLATLSVPATPTDYLNLRQINQALSAYLLSQAAPTSLANAIDVYDGASYAGNIGIDAFDGNLAIQPIGGAVVDVNSSLASQYGLGASALDAIQQELKSPEVLTGTSAAGYSTDITDLAQVMLAFSNDPFKGLTPAQIASQGVEQLSSYSAEQVENLTSADVNALSTAQIQALNSGGFNESAISGFTDATIGALSTGQMAQLDAQQIAAFGAGVGQLSTSQFNAITPQGDAGLDAQFFSKFTAAQVASWSPRDVWSFSAEQINSLSSEALTNLNVSGLTNGAIAGLSSSVIQALSTTQIAQFTSSQAGYTNGGIQQIISQLSPTQITALQPSLIAALPLGWSTVTHSGLSDAQAQALSVQQLAALSAAAVDTAFSINQWNAFASQQLQALNVSNINTQVAGFSEATIAALTSSQVGSLNDLGVYYLGSAVQYLSPSQIAAINVQYLTNNQIEQLNSSQIQALTTTQISQLNTEQLWSLSQGQLASLSTSQLQAITGSQIMNAGATFTSALAPEVLSQLLPVQIVAFSSQQIAGLTDAQISSLTSTQIAALLPQQIGDFSSTQTQAMTSSQIASLTDAQIPALNLAAMNQGQISELSYAQACQLTSEQFDDLDEEQILGLLQIAAQDQSSAPPTASPPQPPPPQFTVSEPPNPYEQWLAGFIGSVIGGWAGGSVGTAVFPGAGTYVGGLIGGAIGEQIGSVVVSGDGTIYYNYWDPQQQQYENVALPSTMNDPDGYTMTITTSAGGGQLLTIIPK